MKKFEGIDYRVLTYLGMIQVLYTFLKAAARASHLIALVFVHSFLESLFPENTIKQIIHRKKNCDFGCNLLVSQRYSNNVPRKLFRTSISFDSFPQTINSYYVNTCQS